MTWFMMQLAGLIALKQFIINRKFPSVLFWTWEGAVITALRKRLCTNSLPFMIYRPKKLLNPLET